MKIQIYNNNNENYMNKSKEKNFSAIIDIDDSDDSCDETNDKKMI